MIFKLERALVQIDQKVIDNVISWLCSQIAHKAEKLVELII